ncbi:hypothetical protein J7M28_12960 [bacterium]|nr:hypothetical protein [bacterium]
MAPNSAIEKVKTYMKTSFDARRFAVILCASLACLLLGACAQAGLTIVEYRPEGMIDYERGIVEAVGRGFAPENALNEAHGKEMARIAAKAIARKNLAELVNGVRVKGVTTVRNMTATSTVEESVNATIFGAVIVKGSEHWNAEAQMFELRMRMPMGRLGDLLLPKDESPSGAKPAYSGVILDCTRATIAPALSIAVFDEKGAKLIELIRPAFRASSTSESAAAKSATYTAAKAKTESGIVGEQPLVVHAIGAKSDAGMSPVVGPADAKRLRELSQAVGGKLFRRAIVIAK